MAAFIQYPAPGTHLLRYCGDVLQLHLESAVPIRGQAFFRTNLGNGDLCRQEIISAVEEDRTPSLQAWHNLPMERVDDFTFVLHVMLHEEGHFEGKCFVAASPEQNGAENIFAEGDNIHINVENAAYCCANGVYCAFVRQFGRNKNKEFSSLPEGISKGDLDLLDRNEYSVIPPSGTFRDLMKELPHIFDRLHCRILHLLPVHPGPTVFGRMGRFGSPYAALDFTGVNPELAEFDRSATALDQFRELVDAVHGKGGKLFIDIAINHTGWGAKLHETHPEWFVKEPSGAFHSPGAWGVTWGDLTELDHSKEELWKYLAGVFRLWCTRGVDGFRCDAGYMIGLPAWKYIVSKVREEFPETVFLLEGLGGDPAVTAELLNSGNMNWAYSELFQNYSREQVEGYLDYAWRESASNGIMIHYAETHDNPRLAALSPEYARMRTALAALSSVSGAFGFTNGVEFFAREKIDVHEDCALNWGSSVNQVDFIGRLNCILRSHPSFRNGASVRCIDSSSRECVLIARSAPDGSSPLLIAVNLDCSRSVQAFWNIHTAPFRGEKAFDLLSGKSVEFVRVSASSYTLQIPGGGVFCLAEDRREVETIELLLHGGTVPGTGHLELQEAKALLVSVLVHRNGTTVCPPDCRDLTRLTDALLRSPEEFLRSLYGREKETPFMIWNFPEDQKRVLPVPPSYWILVKSPERIRAVLEIHGKLRSFSGSLRDSSGHYFLLIRPQDIPSHPVSARLHCSVYSAAGVLTRSVSELLYLPPEILSARIGVEHKLLQKESFRFLQADERGALLYMNVDPGELRSRYDAVLLANLSRTYPENRHIMLRRFRFLCMYDTKSMALTRDCLNDFYVEESGAGVWNFHIPVGNGLFSDVSMRMELLKESNGVRVTLHRHASASHASSRKWFLADQNRIRVQVHPDLEDRDFHGSTKASAGPEQYWPGRIVTAEKECLFHAAEDRILALHSSRGNFRRSDHWEYMVYQQEEASRGLDPYCDLYCPGYFEAELAGGETLVIQGQILRSAAEEPIPVQEEGCILPLEHSQSAPLEKVMLRSMAQYIVRRDDFKTVIAGYPWFLDWGRDTLIVVRGLIAERHFLADAEKILKKFASFAENGTIPNMICGKDGSNRDTSDAPLWLFTACKEYCKAQGSDELLRCVLANGSTLRETLLSLAESIWEGTPNGICCEKNSSLVFSPSHFTWMDTNYPAGTPRQGYPVEIQALWFAAECFLSEILSGEKAALWKERANRTALSIRKYFVLEEGYLSDCLHCERAVPPEEALVSDHLRPNQLYAITLGALEEQELCRSILEKCKALLIPGAIRSLADREVECPLPVTGPGGRLLNDPYHPYRGRYEGEEDTSRKVAYHNGTAWSWQFPAWCEAFYRVYGEESLPTARAVLSTMVLQMNHGCLGHICEIADGDSPHTARGCSAQAWGMSEFLRVWKILHKG